MKNPTYYETIIHSDIWKEWTKLQEETMDFDIWESIECGWLSDAHWIAFINWVQNKPVDNRFTISDDNLEHNWKIISGGKHGIGYLEKMQCTLCKKTHDCYNGTSCCSHTQEFYTGCKGKLSKETTKRFKEVKEGKRLLVNDVKCSK